MEQPLLQNLSTNLQNMSQVLSDLQANALNNNNPSPMTHQLSLNRGHGCNNPARSAPAASPFAATGGTVFRLGEKPTLESFALKGDWKNAKRLFIHEDRESCALNSIISVSSRNALHVAACAGQWEFVVNLVQYLSKDDLGMTDDLGYTALHYAAVGGGVKACQILVKKNPDLTQTMSKEGWTPLLAASRCAPKDKEAVWYLALHTTDAPPGCPFTGPLAGKLAYSLAAGGFHDILLYLIERNPGLATVRDDCGCNLLDALALRPSAFESGSILGSWQKLIYPFLPVKLNYTSPVSEKVSGFSTSPKSWKIFSVKNSIARLPTVGWISSPIKQVQDEKLKHKYAMELVKCVGRELSSLSDPQIYEFFLNSGTISIAAAYGVVEIVELSLQMIPNLIWLPTNQRPLLHIAVQHRQEKILNLLYKMDVYNRLISSNSIDASNNSILHLAAELAPPAHLRIVSGAALQMQRELQWFKEIEKLVHPLVKETPNVWGKTAEDVFMEQHKDLLEKGEQWMKDTANSCMVVAALIATIMFAAVFTVPGGTNEETGIPIFVKDKLFLWFAVSDALGLIFSSTSLVTFLSVLTARYAVEDFLEQLPGLLIRGIALLFLAVVTMMVAFATSFSIVVREGSKSVAKTIIVLTYLPVAAYAFPQLPLFYRMWKSTYRGIFQRAKI